MTVTYPLVLRSPEETAADPAVKRLAFDFIASKQAEGGAFVESLQAHLLANGHHPRAAGLILKEFRRAGATRSRSLRAHREAVSLVF